MEDDRLELSHLFDRVSGTLLAEAALLRSAVRHEADPPPTRTERRRTLTRVLGIAGPMRKEEESIAPAHFAEAIQYRQLDRLEGRR
jgi:hypothetical protein